MASEDERRAARALAGRAMTHVGREPEPYQTIRLLRWLGLDRQARWRDGPEVSELDTPWRDTRSTNRSSWRERAAYLRGEEVFAVDYQICLGCGLGWVEEPYTEPDYERCGLAAAGLAALREEYPGLEWHTLGGHFRDAEPFWSAVGADVPGGYRPHPGVLTFNAAALVELPSGKRPKPLVWTDERVSVWRDDFEARLAAARTAARGKRVDPLQIWISTPRPSPVMVWTPAQTRRFLAAARKHRLYALFHLIAFRGPRRGEACGLRRQDSDLKNAVTTIRWQITQLGWDTEQGQPKTEAGERQLALDKQTVAVIRQHRARQDAEREQAGEAWTRSGFEFTNPDGSALHPAAVTDAFEQIAYLAGLPPIRLHDLRHFAATLALAAGVDIKVVQEQLGHSSRAITSDTYTSVLPEVARAAAEAAAALMSAGTLPPQAGSNLTGAAACQ